MGKPDKTHHNKVPQIYSKDHENESSIEEEEDVEEEGHDHKMKQSLPFFPTLDGKPPKGVPQIKPMKKYPKDENNNKNTLSNNIFLPSPGHNENSFDYSQYEDHLRPQNPNADPDKHLQNILGNTAHIDQLLQHIQAGHNPGPYLHNLNQFQPMHPDMGVVPHPQRPGPG
jgi:hypothetical protein